MSIGELSVLIGCLVGAVIFGWREGRYKRGWKDGARYERDRLSAPEHRHYLITIESEVPGGGVRHNEFSTSLPTPVGMAEFNGAIERARQDLGLKKRPCVIQVVELDRQ